MKAARGLKLHSDQHYHCVGKADSPFISIRPMHLHNPILCLSCVNITFASQICATVFFFRTEILKLWRTRDLILKLVPKTRHQNPMTLEPIQINKLFYPHVIKYFQPFSRVETLFPSVGIQTQTVAVWCKPKLNHSIMINIYVALHYLSIQDYAFTNLLMLTKHS